MLRTRTFIVGKYYVNNARSIARQVVAMNAETVVFNTYHLNSGNSCASSSECTRQGFARWADREATTAETARLQNQQRETLLREPVSPSWVALEFGAGIDPGAVVL